MDITAMPTTKKEARQPHIALTQQLHNMLTSNSRHELSGYVNPICVITAPPQQ
jgi:hypothetical protein